MSLDNLQGKHTERRKAFLLLFETRLNEIKSEYRKLHWYQFKEKRALRKQCVEQEKIMEDVESWIPQSVTDFR